MKATEVPEARSYKQHKNTQTRFYSGALEIFQKKKSKKNNGENERNHRELIANMSGNYGNHTLPHDKQ